MATSVVHNTGLQPQDGFRLPIPVKEGASPMSITKKRRFRHVIDNSIDSDRVLTPGAGVPPYAGWTYQDGYYIIPYTYMRAAMRPPWLEEMMRQYDLIALKSVGFTIIAVNVQEQQAKRFGDATIIQSVDANVPEFHMMVMSDWLSSRTGPVAGAWDDPNNEMKTELPKTHNVMKLVKGHWVLSEDQMTFIDDKGFLASLDGVDNPPFAIEQMATIQVGTAKGWQFEHHYKFPKFFATCNLDSDNRGIPGLVADWNNPQYKFPNVLARESWARFAIDPMGQQNYYTDIPKKCGIRLDRVHTLGGDLLRNAVIDVEYHATFEVVPTYAWGFYSTHAIALQVYTDPWTAAYRRMWSPITPHMVAFYNLHYTFTKVTATGPQTTEEQIQNKRSEGVYLRDVMKYCLKHDKTMDQFEVENQAQMNAGYGQGFDFIVKDGDNYVFRKPTSRAESAQ